MPGYWIPKNNGYEYVRTSFSNLEKYAEIHEQEKNNKNDKQLKEKEKNWCNESRSDTKALQ